jgi:hypothetical protein
MTTPDNLTTDPIAAAEAGRLWRVVERCPGVDKPVTRLIEADFASPWPGSALHLWNKGAGKDERRSVLALAADAWWSCEPVG